MNRHQRTRHLDLAVGVERQTGPGAPLRQRTSNQPRCRIYTDDPTSHAHMGTQSRIAG